MIALSERHEPVDIVTLTASLRAAGYLEAVGGVDYISHVVDIVPTSANTQYYARIIREMAIRRKMIHEAAESSSAPLLRARTSTPSSIRSSSGSSNIGRRSGQQQLRPPGRCG